MWGLRRKLAGPALAALVACAGMVVEVGGGASAAASGTGMSTRGSATAAQPNTWVPTGAMVVARSGQTATHLRDGDVLVAGGGTAKAELYDPSTGRFTATGSMSVARSDATATLLPDGDVLVAGGIQTRFRQLATAELYDPDSSTWTQTGSMTVARSGQTATLLPDGDVLVAGGGCNGQGYGCNSGSALENLTSAELYDPATGTWTATGSMREGRQFATATLLPDGDVLVAGGFTSCDDDFCFDLATAELYDPATGTWTRTGSMHLPREQFTATLLPDGDVLAVGGLNQGGDSLRQVSYAEAELYDPATGSWTQTASMAQPHAGQGAALLPGGWVLVAGGGTASAQLYEPARGVWVTPGSMSTPRTHLTVTLLAGDRVLVTGGAGPDGTSQATAEVFDGGAGPLVTLAPGSLSLGSQIVGTRGGASMATVTNDGTAPLEVAGLDISGADPGDVTATTDCTTKPVAPGGTCTVSVRFAPSHTGLRSAVVALADNAPQSPQGLAVSGYGAGPDTWAPTGSLNSGREDATATLLADGDVLVAGGDTGYDEPLASAELYDPSTGAFNPTGSLLQARSGPAAALLPDGEVLVAGGLGEGPAVLATAELYDPATDTWTSTTSMNSAGTDLTATVLPDGDVLVAGFVTGAFAELYDPATATWADTGPATFTAVLSTATLLPDGDVLAAGSPTTEAALYDPATDTWSTTGSMLDIQIHPTATLLPDGEVLVAGGETPEDGQPVATSELYDPSTGSWSLTSGQLTVPRYGATATLLPDGDVLVAGGCTEVCDRHDVTPTAELFDPTNGFWTQTGAMTEGRYAQTATLLGDGDVLVAGGSDYCCQMETSADVYTPTLMSIMPTSGAAGSTVTISGSGYFAHEEIQISWEGLAESYVRTTSAGSFSTTTSVPDIPPGSYSVSADGSTSYASAFTTFVVTASP